MNILKIHTLDERAEKNDIHDSRASEFVSLVRGVDNERIGFAFKFVENPLGIFAESVGYGRSGNLKVVDDDLSALFDRYGRKSQ